MTDREIIAGNISILRKTRNIREIPSETARSLGIRSFNLEINASEERRSQPVWSNSFSRGLVKSLIPKK